MRLLLHPRRRHGVRTSAGGVELVGRRCQVIDDLLREEAGRLAGGDAGGRGVARGAGLTRRCTGQGRVERLLAQLRPIADEL